ncbi:MAG: Kelch repeat-containing protein [Actinomycetota bacterium]
MDRLFSKATGGPIPRALKAFALAALLVVLSGSPTPAAPPDGSRATAPMPQAMSEFSATLLKNGKVLVAGGGYDGPPRDTALLYDPVADAWMPTGQMLEVRRLHTATLLTDGRVLVYGGRSQGPEDYNLSTAEVYDPAAGTWSAAGSTGPRGETGAHLEAAQPGSGRMHHTATLLKDGRVLVAGGHTAGHGQGDDDAWLYDPSKNSWTQTGSFATGRRSHAAVLLSDGKVLVTGGQQGGHDPSLGDGIVYDPASGQWTPAKSLMTAQRAGHTMTLLKDGRVLVAGGRAKLVGGAKEDTLVSAEIYDPATSRFTATAPMATPRHFHEALLDSAGKVVVATGVLGGSGEPVNTVEVFDPASGYWNLAGELPAAKDKDGNAMDYVRAIWLAPDSCGRACRSVLALNVVGGQVLDYRYASPEGPNGAKADGRGGNLPLIAGAVGAAAMAIAAYFLLLSRGARLRRRRKALTG